MDELEISGKRYFSTRRAAKEHKYTSDYVGQLIRSGKVVGQKVGRSWYVSEESLNTYLSGEKESEVVPVVKTEVAQKEIVEEKPAPTLKEVGEPTASVGFEEIKAEEKVSVQENAPEEKKVEEQIAEKVKPEVIKEPEEKTFEPVIVSEKEPDEYRIPIRTTVVSMAEKPLSGLRYVADDEPALPEVKRKSAVTSIPVKPVRHVQPEEEYDEQYVEVRPHSRAPLFAVASLVAIGIVTLSVTAILSATLNSKIVVEKGQVANVGYTFK